MVWFDIPFTEISVDEIYKTDENFNREDVDTLLEWMKKQPHLPQATELQVILFLHSCYYNIERTKRTIDTFFTIRTLSPDVFGSRTLQDPLLRTASKCGLSIPLPKLTSNGEAIFFGKLMDYNTANYDPIGQSKMFDVNTSLFLHKNGPVKGIQIVLDLSHFTFGHFLKFTPNLVRKFLYYLQEGMPIRLKSVHFINVVSFLDKMLAFVKPFMTKELYDSIKVHSNIETLYEYVPKDLLPAEYGGSLESSEILQEKMNDLISDSEEFLKFQESQVIDKAKRPKMEEFEELSFGVAGSFKKLEVD